MIIEESAKVRFCTVTREILRAKGSKVQNTVDFSTKGNYNRTNVVTEDAHEIYNERTDP